MKLWSFLKSLLAKRAPVPQPQSHLSSNAAFAKRKAQGGATLHAHWFIPETEALPARVVVPIEEQLAN